MTCHDHVRQELEGLLLTQKVQFPFKVDACWLIVVCVRKNAGN